MVAEDGTVGLLLAGGLARRMGGGDKGLKSLGGQPILDRIIERVRDQVRALALNANRDPCRFDRYRLPVLPDAVDGFAGPLAGVLTGLEWAAQTQPGCSYVATFPTDAPFLPRDLVARLHDAMVAESADMACAASGGCHHPVVGLWPMRLAADLRRAVVDEEIRKVDAWTGRFDLAVAEFSTDPVDPFFNANCPDDLEEAETLLRRRSSVS